MRLLDPRGVVIASSGAGLGENLSGDPEVAAALSGQTGAELRPRPPASRRQPLDSISRRARVRVFIAKPVLSPSGQVAGAVLLSRTPREELQALYQMAPRLLWGVGFALLETPQALAATEVTVTDRNGEFRAVEMVELPFYDAEKNIPRGLPCADGFGD